MALELLSAKRVGDVLNGVTERVGEVVGWINAPLVLRSKHNTSQLKTCLVMQLNKQTPQTLAFLRPSHIKTRNRAITRETNALCQQIKKLQTVNINRKKYISTFLKTFVKTI